MSIYIGTAAWAIPAAIRDQFPGEDSLLERYARQFTCTEINTTFYHHHQNKTFFRWAQSVPDDFRFAVKLHKSFTHEGKLKTAAEDLKNWFGNVSGLGSKLGVILVQTPGKLEFRAATLTRFLKNLRTIYAGHIAIEARNLSWASAEAENILNQFGAKRAIADPARIPNPVLNAQFVYLRLHGTPQIYKSTYTPDSLLEWRARIDEANALGATTWCIFDNTTLGCATHNALSMLRP